MITRGAYREELHLSDRFAFVTSVHRAPADEFGAYDLQLALDIFIPGRHLSFVFESERTLDAFYGALRCLVDDHDQAWDDGEGALIVRVFTSRAPDDNDPQDGELTL